MKGNNSNMEIFAFLLIERYSKSCPHFLKVFRYLGSNFLFVKVVSLLKNSDRIFQEYPFTVCNRDISKLVPLIKRNLDYFDI